MSSKKVVAILFGGVSAEHDVSVVSARSVTGSLDRDLFEPVFVGIDKQGSWHLGGGAFDLLETGASDDVDTVILSTDPARPGFLSLKTGNVTKVDVIFPVLHGPRGEDGTMQGLFEICGIPYVGCDTMASAIAMDKDMTKRVLAQGGLPVVKGVCVSAWVWKTEQEEVLDEIAETLEFPVFIKPNTMGSSIGISKADSVDEMIRGIDLALQFSPKVVIEQAVPNAREIEVSVLGNNEPRASTPGEIIPCNEFYDFEAKYVSTATELIIPAKLPRQFLDDIQFTAVEAFVAIGGSGMARVDFLVGSDGHFVNEINTIPGFTSVSMYPKLWEASGLPYGTLITTLIELAFKRHEELEALTKTITLEKRLGV
ncbi:MAG TPA: D-alanine--D-alanine ligase family protein [Deltaproteobacteria bacterium]|nr:D-alanine--D-alanine ligase family protein [Deltaproteobacteria bacterium]HOI06766.1 D-alanine--D-alanine ligase family protein [Deltaproteobacteria bacterium]